MKSFSSTSTRLFLLLFSLVVSFTALGQQPTAADYERAVALQWGQLRNKAVLNDAPQPVWAEDSSGVLFVLYRKDGKDFYKVDSKTARKELLFESGRMAELLSTELNKTISPRDLPLSNLRYRSAARLEFSCEGQVFVWNSLTQRLEKRSVAAASPTNITRSVSPNGKWEAYTEGYNLYLRSTADGKVRQLSQKGARGYEYGTTYGWSDIIEGENGERPSRFLVRWSPDSRWIQTLVTDFRQAEKMYLLDWSIDSLYKPKLLSYYRASPGDTTIVRLIPVFYEVETGREIQLDQLYSTHTNPVQFRWAEQPDMVYQERMFRGYQQVELHRRHLAKGTEELLYRETSSTNIDNFRSQLIEEWGKALITSERDGWKQLYLLDLRDGALRRLASGDYYVNEVVHIDKAKRVVLFTASGKEAGRNPYYQHFYRLDVEKGTLQLLTPEDSNHEVWVSPDGRYFVDHLSTLNQPTRTLLRSTTDGKVALVVSEAEVSGLRALHPNPFPEPFTAIGRDGRTEIYGAIWKPSHFDPNKRYPVIDQSYTGPHTFMFPRSFTSALSRSNQALAELGFVVITVDGMGTANRSKAFHTVSYKNMGKNLEDHRLAILQLGRRYTWLDTTRVGIFGHSAGGYDAAHALLEYPDFYKVAVASSADHDFRMEKAWWPEMYMGWPVDSTYHEVSNITMAHKLKGKLLITHGGIDENVNPSATFKLAEALVRANKEFDMLIFPSQRHGYVGHVNTYFTKKKWNYFVEHLLGAKPLWEFKMQ